MAHPPPPPNWPRTADPDYQRIELSAATAVSDAHYLVGIFNASGADLTGTINLYDDNGANSDPIVAAVNLGANDGIFLPSPGIRLVNGLGWFSDSDTAGVWVYYR